MAAAALLYFDLRDKGVYSSSAILSFKHPSYQRAKLKREVWTLCKFPSIPSSYPLRLCRRLSLLLGDSFGKQTTTLAPPDSFVARDPVSLTVGP